MSEQDNAALEDELTFLRRVQAQVESLASVACAQAFDAGMLTAENERLIEELLVTKERAERAERSDKHARAALVELYNTSVREVVTRVTRELDAGGARLLRVAAEGLKRGEG